MDIECSETQLSNKLAQIFVSTSNNYSTQPRQSNTLIAAQMPFELDPSHIKQYNKMYLNRLSVLGKRIPLMKIYRVQQVQAKYGTISIIGIFKRIQNKRVRAFEKNYEQYYGKSITIYDINDTLEIEDDSGKIKFILAPGCTMNGRKIKPTDLPYGVVLGLTGRNNDEKMQFFVQKITLPSLPNQKPIKNKTYLNRKTLIMSAPSLQSLKQTFTQIFDVGSLPLYNSIKSIIILGFSHKLTANQYRQLDNLLAKYNKQINIHIMPNQVIGEIYPQKPIHPILFSNSWRNLSLANNPQMFYTNDQQIEGDLSQVNYEKLPGSILVCSGENIKDLAKNCSFGQSQLDTMQSILEYSHLAPSSPFSLKCEMMRQDYLVINQLPHVFVAGGYQKTDHKEWQASGKKVKLVSIKQGSNILLDIDTYKINQFQVQPASPYQNS